MSLPECGDRTFDAVIVGGGIYGCAIAIYLAKHKDFKKILLVEREAALLTRASYNNQARVHNGYHYPRSFVTAYRSRVNLPRFISDWPVAVKTDFTKLYAIARKNSKVTARQFQRFCKEIGASLEPADLNHRRLFESRLIEDVFIAQEYVFDATVLAKCARQELEECSVETIFQTQVRKIFERCAQSLELELIESSGQEFAVTARWVLNCTYSGLNQLGGDFEGTSTGLKHEIAELALMQMPPVLSGLGITVMDGPFFSIMPFPARSLHTMSHVRYTPHMHWVDKQGLDPYKQLAAYPKETRVDRMLRDVSRYLPAVTDSSYKGSLFETKTVLLKNETDDGRPILLEKHSSLSRLISVLGGKVDNIFDVYVKLDRMVS